MTTTGDTLRRKLDAGSATTTPTGIRFPARDGLSDACPACHGVGLPELLIRGTAGIHRASIEAHGLREAPPVADVQGNGYGRDMAKCEQCGKQFDPSDAKSEYDAEFGGDLDYTESYDGKVCANCAIPETQGNMDLGPAIQMMNGDEDYDDDFVTEPFN